MLKLLQAFIENEFFVVTPCYPKLCRYSETRRWQRKYNTRKKGSYKFIYIIKSQCKVKSIKFHKIIPGSYNHNQILTCNDLRHRCLFMNASCRYSWQFFRICNITGPVYYFVHRNIPAHRPSIVYIIVNDSVPESASIDSKLIIREYVSSSTKQEEGIWSCQFIMATIFTKRQNIWQTNFTISYHEQYIRAPNVKGISQLEMSSWYLWCIFDSLHWIPSIARYILSLCRYFSHCIACVSKFITTLPCRGATKGVFNTPMNSISGNLYNTDAAVGSHLEV